MASHALASVAPIAPVRVSHMPIILDVLAHCTPVDIQQDPYRFLVCADKFQTGYDEPLLHTRPIRTSCTT